MQFPYLAYFSFAIEHYQSKESYDAFYCIYLCMDWEDLDNNQFMMPEIIDFVIQCLSALDEATNNRALHVLSIFCAENQEIIIHLIDSNIISYLQFFSNTRYFAQIIQQLLSIKHSQYEEALKLLAIVFLSSDTDVLKIGIQAVDIALSVDPESYQYLITLIDNHAESLFTYGKEDISFLKTFLKILYQFDLPIQYGLKLYDIILYIRREKILIRVFKIMFKNRVEWKALGFIYQPFIAIIRDSAFKVQKYATLVLISYYDFQRGYDKYIAKYLLQFLPDPDLTEVCLLGLYSMLTTWPHDENLESLVSQAIPYLTDFTTSEDVKIASLASKDLDLINNLIKKEK